MFAATVPILLFQKDRRYENNLRYEDLENFHRSRATKILYFLVQLFPHPNGLRALAWEQVGDAGAGGWGFGVWGFHTRPRR